MKPLPALRPVALPALSLGLLAVAASAQSLNVDFGMGPAPSTVYGAASGQVGHWAPVNPTTGFANLPDITGAPTTVAVNLGGNLGFGSFDAPATGGDDGLLMDDYVDVGFGPAKTYAYFLSLEPGVYDVWVYAWNPGSPNALTGVEIAVGSFGDPATSGGAWPGGHAAGVTYTKHSGWVPGAVVIVASSEAGDAVLNGVQFVKRDTPVGTSYCPATPNSTLLPALISGHGSTSVQANDLALVAEPIPAGQPGLFYYGPAPDLTPFGNGFRCVAGPYARLPIGVSSGGVLVHLLDSTNPPTGQGQILPGSTWYFQAWFRDPAAGFPGFDLSDGLEVAFTP